MNRVEALKVFLGDPDVPLDTNHLERALRVIPMGRENWLFCWTEFGAEQVGIIQTMGTSRFYYVELFFNKNNRQAALRYLAHQAELISYKKS